MTPAYRPSSLLAGCAVLAVVLSPPMHELSHHWFSVHMIEHELLMAVVAPLLVFGRPMPMLLRRLPRDWRRASTRWAGQPVLRWAWLVLTGPLLAWILHTLALWLWHVPALFEAALHNHLIHAFQHLTFLAAALIYWASLVANRHGSSGYGIAVFSLFATSLQCALLGALLTLSVVPWYPDYPQLSDQQWAGLVMWVPAGLVYTIAGIAFLVLWLRESEMRTQRWERSLAP
jgi:cytochrome c oxidase assembly factor CtaG